MPCRRESRGIKAIGTRRMSPMFGIMGQGSVLLTMFTELIWSDLERAPRISPGHKLPFWVRSGEALSERVSPSSNKIFQKNHLFIFYFFSRSGGTNTPRGGVVNCAQDKILGIPFRNQRTLDAHSPLPSGDWCTQQQLECRAPQSSPTSPNVNGCVVQGPIRMPRPLQPIKTKIITSRAQR